MNCYSHKISELEMNIYHMYKRLIYSSFKKPNWLKVYNIIKDLKSTVIYG
jgi:hypothetical protein